MIASLESGIGESWARRIERFLSGRVALPERLRSRAPARVALVGRRVRCTVTLANCLCSRRLRLSLKDSNSEATPSWLEPKVGGSVSG
jgi:hypothetical protein